MKNNHKIVLDKNGHLILKKFNKNIIKKLEIFVERFIYSKLNIWMDKNILKIKNLKRTNLRKKFYNFYIQSNKKKIYRNPYYFFYDKVIFNLITNKKLIEIVKTLLKSNTFYLSGLFNIRFAFPHCNDYLAKTHNDIDSFLNLETKKKSIDPKMITLWIPLNNINKKNSGELIFLKPYKRLFLNKNDLLFFDSHLFHKSAKNLTNRTRWAIDLRFEAPDENGNIFEITKKQGFKILDNNKINNDFLKFLKKRGRKFFN